ncbi:ABC transporter permease [Microbacterium sp. zg.Y1090]|uniref:ABC transporter permease n=1 Tax=Microbacterium TaxID=33882 RepID=UPI00214C9E20|nr:MULTISPECIES: ABC transporter permease [unclassified Microbacterium]MCR2801274.1 ABC transporter permease [Microbacterium sp. zg.Y818]MCR2812090.1 ABC transporter permease [Microbacterium sp. zg.Y1084]MCR2818471.1 ABC transporter permease [Microbacterium sp. zg.Y1090]MDL5486284.1 ABC transporter permease [Microbacterium sp. zg-Y1211]WIM21106.1 ABC transporter permease [Microbacterium sp. zg-Y818]
MSNNSTPQNDAIYDLAEAEDAALAAKDTKPLSQGRLVLRRFLRHRAALISTVLLFAIIIVAFTSIGFAGIPGWWDKSYLAAGNVIDGGRPTLSLIPTWLGGDGIRWGEHPFGQDNVGKDYFSLVMVGTQRSLIIAFTVGIVATTIGAVMGAVAGYFRGWVDNVLMRITDIFIVIPLLVLAAVLGKISGGGIFALALMIGLASWTGLARLVRGEVLSLRERDYVAAARSTGASAFRIIFKHLVPNTIGIIVVNATFAIGGAILLESSLSFLGFGVRAPETSLGLLISTYQGAFTNRPWLFWWPGMIILVIVLAVNFIGDGLRDAFDPRQTRKWSPRRLERLRAEKGLS